MYGQVSSIASVTSTSSIACVPLFRSTTKKYRKNKSSEYCYAPRLTSTRGAVYLNIDNMHKMMRRFIDEKGLSKNELASALEITVKNLEKLFLRKVPAGLLSRVNISLVRLYCATRW